MRRVLSALAFSFALGVSSAALATPVSQERFNVTIRDQDVREVLLELSGALGIPITVSDAVQGRVSASFESATAEELLDTIARARGLDWRFDGRRIDVTAKSEQATRILDLDGVRIAELVSALQALEVYEDRFPMTALDGEIGMIVAPPNYIALVEVVLARLVERHEAERIAAEAEAARRQEATLRAEEARREHQRLKRAHALALEQEKQRRKQTAPTGPVIVRNGVWGG